MIDDRLPLYIIAYRIITVPIYYLAMCCMFTAILVTLFDIKLAQEFWAEWRPDWSF